MLLISRAKCKNKIKFNDNRFEINLITTIGVNVTSYVVCNFTFLKY